MDQNDDRAGFTATLSLPRRYPMRFRSTILILAALAACADDPTGPRVKPAPEAPRALGLVEITFTRLGTGEMGATVTPAGLAGGASRSVAAVPGAVPGGTIQLGLRTTSTVDAGGQRYLQAVFRVRNAMADGTPNARVLRNVTFVPVSDSRTLPGTPVLRFLKQDGTPADPALAAQLKPTGAVADNGTGGLAPQYPDVLQAYTEDEVAAIDMSGAPSVTNRFPYGFVTRRADNTATRDLPASPAPEQYDGAVTFAYRFPTQSSAANNPFTISILALAVEDDVTRITQSIEEQGAGQAAFEARAASLNASQARIFPGGAYSGPIPHIVICSVRTAGTREAPTSHIGSDGVAFASLSPNPYTGAGSFIARDASLAAMFSGSVTGAGPGTFAVHTFQSAGRFLNGSYSGNGTSTVTYSHAGTFFPGEEVEVSLTNGLACAPHVARLRTATAPATGRYAGEVFPIEDTTRAAVARDVNADGHLDYVSVYGAGISVLLGDGTGRFGAPVNTAVRTSPAALAVGDVNGDGRPDVVTANPASNNVSIYLGNGDGRFTSLASVRIFTSPQSVALGDVNGDGKLDLATANINANTVTVLLGDGAGGFPTRAEYPVGTSPSFVALADLTGDGKVDVAVGNAGSGTVGVLAGNGSGGFSAAASYPASNPRTLGFGDLNGDGRTDIVSAGGSVLLATAGGGFTAGPALGGPSGVELGDFNGDGRLDLVGSRLRLGDGAGGFGPPTGPAIEFDPRVGDLNEDGRLDTFGSYGGYVGVLLGTGAGLDGAASGAGGLLADVNADGKLDAVSGSVRLGDGSGGFSSGREWPAAGQATALALGDVDNDGLLDAVTANGTRNFVAVNLNDGSGSFSEPTRFPAGNAPVRVALGDVNGDGNLDIVTGNWSQDNVVVLLGDGSGGFGAPAAFSGPVSRQSVALGDLNNDGKLDIATSMGRVLLGDGMGRFTVASQGVAAARSEGSAVLADVNGDGRLDLTRSTLDAKFVYVSLGNGSGGFTSTVALAVLSGPAGVQVGDLNGDGRLDIAASNFGAGSVSVLLGDGGGGFAPARHYRANSVALGDVNGDARLDVVAGNTILFGQAP